MLLKGVVFIFFIAFSNVAFCDFDFYDEYNIENADFLIRIARENGEDTLNLPSNATSIRENIVDTFSCENRTYGYYADVDNDCQIFHVCQPVMRSSRKGDKNETLRYSFICPNETIFNQELLTCTRPDDSIPCEDSPMYYHMNEEQFGEHNDMMEEDDGGDKNKKPEGDTNQNNAKRPSFKPYVNEQNYVPLKKPTPTESIMMKVEEPLQDLMDRNDDNLQKHTEKNTDKLTWTAATRKPNNPKRNKPQT